MQDDQGIKKENKTVATCGETEAHDAQRHPISLYIPQTVLEEYRANQKENRRRDAFRKRLEIGALIVAAFYALITLKLWLTAKSTAEQTNEAFHTAQRPYVALGGRDGKIGELLNLTVKGKPIITLHFYNGGQSTARHFKVYIGATIPGANKSNFRHRHRYRASDREIITEGETNVGLAAQSEHMEYVLDPNLLWTWSELNDINGEFAIGGDLEYCDEFGTYHCQGWAAEYKPLLGAFIPGGPIDLPCVVEQGDAAQLERTLRNARPDVAVKEIEPCEQPNEPEYYHRIDVGATITAHVGFEASATVQTPKPTPTK
jgi:hypothetical protein